MTGASWRALQHCTAERGRVLVSLLTKTMTTEIHTQPELMLRRFEALELESPVEKGRLRRRAGGAHRVACAVLQRPRRWCWTPMR